MNHMVKYFLLMLMLPTASLAGGGLSGSGKISHLYQRVTDGLVAVFKEDGEWNNPDKCESHARIVSADVAYRNELYSAI